MKMLTRILALLMIAHFSIVGAAALDADRLPFNGSDLRRVSDAGPGVLFRSQADPDFVETVAIRKIEAGSGFSAAVRALVARAKSDSHGAKLKMLERPNADDVIVIYLADTTSNKVIYKAERLSGALGGSNLLSMSYAADFEAGNIDDDQENKIKRTAADALAKFEIGSVGSLLEIKP